MQKIQKIKTVLSIFTIFLLLIGGFYFLTPKTMDEISIPMPEYQDTALELTVNEKIEIEKKGEVIKDNLATLEISGARYQDKIQNNTSVYDFMEKLREKGQVNFKEKTYVGMGKFIDEINDIRGNGSLFWIYYVNGKKAQIGVSNYKINPGDVVSWKYEKDIN